MPEVLLMAGLILPPTMLEPVPCTIVGDIVPTAMVRAADAIVRVVAVEYSKPPSSPAASTTGGPDSVIRFKTVEVLKGKLPRPGIELPGYLSDADDFNDHRPPYTFVRPGGRGGSCFANTYRRGAEFLLMLKQTGQDFTVEWYPLGPVNEQLRSPDDPWLLWVRREVK